MANERRNIREKFEVEYLPEESRFAAEMTAIQKLVDFSDYLKIFSDNSLDPLFREKAGNMIRELFISEEARLSFGNIERNHAKSYTLGQFLETGFGKHIWSAEIVFDSIHVLEPLQKHDAASYKGKLACKQTLVTESSRKVIAKNPPEPITVEIMATRTTKIFGPDTLMVWTVFLGDMQKNE
jgi:hypothetical protein